jgi:hypothetical protein
MIKTGNTIVIASLAIIFLMSVCEKEARKHEHQEITGELVSHSECKSNKSAEITSGEKDFSKVIFLYKSSEQKLKLSHINAGFNCCPGGISCKINYNSDTINIIESEEKASCNCDCLFDLEIEVEGIEAKTYFLNFDEPYVDDQAKLQFSVNLAYSDSGSFTVNRSMYPWME